MNVPVIVGEWGSFGDETDDWLPHIQFLFEVFEKYHWSQTYWAFIPGFFENRVMKVYRRPYPKAISGKIEKYHYDLEAKTFTLEFTQDDKSCGESIIGMPFEVESVTVDGENCEIIKNDYELFLNTTAGKHSVEIKVR